jgi:precorrin-6B methylase 2
MTSVTPDPLTDSELLFIFIHGTTVFELLRTALEFELFEHLEASGGMDIPQVAEALDVAEQPARILLLGLASLRLVRREDGNGKYINADITRRKLLRSSPRFLGPLVDVQAEITNPSITDFAESMRRNTNVGLRKLSGPGATLYERLAAYPYLEELFYRHVRDMTNKSFPLILEKFDFSALQHVVDLGGGDASNAIELVKRYPHLEVTVYERESVIQIAKRNVVEAGVADRIHLAARDIFTDALPRGLDCLLVLHVFGIFSLARNTELFRRCYEALPEGGPILAYDFVSNDDNTGPLTAGLASPYFLTLSSGEGMMYSARDMETCLQDAGFSQTVRYLGKGSNQALVVGYK